MGWLHQTRRCLAERFRGAWLPFVLGRLLAQQWGRGALPDQLHPVFNHLGFVSTSFSPDLLFLGWFPRRGHAPCPHVCGQRRCHSCSTNFKGRLGASWNVNTWTVFQQPWNPLWLTQLFFFFSVRGKKGTGRVNMCQWQKVQRIQLPLMSHQSIWELSRGHGNVQGTLYIDVFACPHSFGTWRTQPPPFDAGEVFRAACVLYICKYLPSSQLYTSCTFSILCGVTCHSRHTDISWSCREL